MLQLIRTVETPSRFDRAYLQGRYPGYTILGARAGWFYPVHPTKVVLVAGTWAGLTKAVFQHLSANKLVVPLDLAGEMADWWCREVDGSDCAKPVDLAAQARAVSLQSLAARFLRTAISWALSGAKFVDQAEAERRAALCAGCPLKGEVDCRGNCIFTRLVNTAMKLFGGKATSRDADLADCLVCGCRQRVLVWIPLEHLHDPSLDGRWPTEYPCWHKPHVSSVSLEAE